MSYRPPETICEALNAMSDPADEKEVVGHMLKAAQGIHIWILESQEGTDVSGWVYMRDWLLERSEAIFPPQPCWPDNVVPFVPRARG